MKVSAQERRKNHDEIIKSAASAFRAKGVNGVGLETIMTGAGLTPGAFYGHFGSKEDLVSEALEYAFDRSIEMMEDAAKTSPDDPIAGMIATYLSAYYRDTPEDGCAIAGMGCDVRLCGAEVKKIFSRCFLDMTSMIATHFETGTRAGRRDKSMVVAAALIGTMIVARSVNEQQFSDEIMSIVGKTLTELVK